MASTYAVTRLLATVKHLHPVLKSIQNITLFDRILACIMREKRTRGTFSISKRDTSNRTQLANGTEFVTNDIQTRLSCLNVFPFLKIYLLPKNKSLKMTLS